MTNPIDHWLMSRVASEIRDHHNDIRAGPSKTWNRRIASVENLSFETEVPLSKGQGQYKTTMGFLDGCVKFDVKVEIRDCYQWEKMEDVKTWSKTSTQLWTSDEMQTPPTQFDVKTIRQSLPKLVSDKTLIRVQIESQINHTPDTRELSLTDIRGMRTKYLWLGNSGYYALKKGEWERIAPKICALPVETYGWVLKPMIVIDVTGIRRWVEVKIAKETIGNILRQIKFYREFMTDGSSDAAHQPFILASLFDLSDREIELLDKECIGWVQLGPAFQKWYAAQQDDGRARKRQRLEL